MRGKLLGFGLVAILSACSAPKTVEPVETLEEKAAWEYYGGKIDLDKGMIEGGYLNDMHDVANLSLGLAKSAEKFEYDGSAESFDLLIRYGMQAEFAADNIRKVYEERESAKEKFSDSWDYRINNSFQLVLNKFVKVYDTLDAAWEEADEKINFRELNSDEYDAYMSAKDYFSSADLTMRMYRDVATQVKVPLLEESASHRQRER
jgi:hypothetical protein